MNKLSMVLLGLFAVIFVVAFFIGSNLNIFLRILFSLVFAAFGTLYFWNSSGGKKNSKTGITNPSIKNRNKTIYIYEPFAPTFTYRIEKGRIYSGWDNKFVYRIENGKIYKGMEATPFLVIEGNKVYQFMGNHTPIYIIENNKIYEGDFGVKPIYEIKDK